MIGKVFQNKKILLYLFLFILNTQLIQAAELSSKRELQVTFIKSIDPQCNKNNLVWIGTTDGLYVADNTKQNNPIPVSGIKETHIKNIMLELGKYWVTSHNGLYYIDPKSPFVAKPIDGLEDKIIVNFYKLPNTNLIAFDSKKKVYLINTTSYTASSFDELENKTISTITDNICIDNNCLSDSQNYIWLYGNLKGGLFRIDKNNANQAQEIIEFKDKIVTNIQQIKNTIWISTMNDGLFIMENSTVTKIQGLEKTAITQLINIGDYLLIGTLRDGMHFIEQNKEQKIAHSITELSDESISLITITNKYAWIARDFRGGIYRVNLQKPSEVVKVNSFGNRKVLDILSFAGNIWVKVGQDQLYGIDEELLAEITKVNILKNKNISDLKIIAGNLFFIETTKGAFVANEQNPKEIIPIKGLEEKKINAIYFKGGLIWAETYEHEIYIIKPEEPATAIALKEMNGINIWSIAKFQDDNFVVGSNKGAFIVDSKELGQVKTFPETSNESTTSIIQVCGKLWVGTLDGYKVLDINK